MAARLTADGLHAPDGARPRGPVPTRRGATPPVQQLGFFGEEVRVEIRPDPALEALAAKLTGTDPNRLTPIEALQLLATLRDEALARGRTT
jgi:hypothetical protein